MYRRYRRKRRILKSLVLGFAIAAIAAPAALGEPRGPGNPVGADAIRTVVSPDDRSSYRGTSSQTEHRIISPDDRSLFRGVEAPSSTPVTVTVSAPSSAFQWADAGLGAASMLAFVLLLGAGTLMLRHQRRRLVVY